MKKAFLLAALTLFAAASCQKNVIPECPEEAVLDGPTGQILLKIGQPETKVAVSGMSEHSINQVQVFVFNTAGALETDRVATNTASTAGVSVTLTSKIGLKTIYALVNAPRVKPKTLTELEGTVSDLKDNSVNNLVMVGKTEITVEEYSGKPMSFDIPVRKLAAAVVLAGVNVDFRNTALEGSSFVLKEVYVKNVVGRVPYGNPTSPGDVLYNKKTLDTAPLELTFDACNLTSYATPNRVLYVYPNAKKGETCLVLHAKVAGTDTYYPFDLPVLEANKKYSVTVSITMLGKPDDNDDSRVTVGIISPTITIKDWDNTYSLPYNM